MSAIECYAEPERLPTGEAARFARLLKLRDADGFTDLKLAHSVARGLPASAVSAVADMLAATVVARLVPEATLRRARQARKPLSREHSERLYDVARVLDAVGRAYHGDKARVDGFLNRPHPLLEGETPLDLAVSSSAGAEAVLNLIERADAGVAV
jgi:putative toxin-antitoxin system antitoxin component (TIGR02293 family)